MNAGENNFNQTLQLLPDADLAKVWYVKGEQLANLGNYTQALSCFDQVVAIQPLDHAAWVFRGVVLIHLQRYEAALYSCEKALEIQPTDKQAWLFRGAALNHLGRYKQCYDSYDKALGIERQSIWQKITQIAKAALGFGNSSRTTAVTTSS